VTTTEAERCRGSCEPCGLRSFKRNRYFDGKLLVTADFQDEQSYLRGKDRLHASHLHGAGTVCGLKLRQHPNPACRNRYVTLEPGLALDCCGNEIVVDREVQIDLRAAIEEALRERQLFPLDEAGRDVFVHPSRLAVQADSGRGSERIHRRVPRSPWASSRPARDPRWAAANRRGSPMTHAAAAMDTASGVGSRCCSRWASTWRARRCTSSAGMSIFTGQAS
jgi:hypothetical protein